MMKCPKCSFKTKTPVEKCPRCGLTMTDVVLDSMIIQERNA